MPRKANPNTKLILERYCEYTGHRFVYEMPKMMAAAKNLANYGLEPENLAALLDWSRTTWAGRDGTDLVVGQMVYAKWLDNGRPGVVDLNRTQEERVKAIRESTDPKYLGSAGSRRRQRDIEAIINEGVTDEETADIPSAANIPA